MSTTIGIDIGGSTTKIVGFRREKDGQSVLMTPQLVRATDPVTSVYGAFGKFTAENNLELADIDRVMMTGVGAGSIEKPIYNLPCHRVEEFRAIGLGGLYLSGLERAIVVSMGTGTALVWAQNGETMQYLGGTGVGGGTLVGLSKLLLKMDSIVHIQSIAGDGDLSKIDLRIGDIMKKGGTMRADMTAANFGNVSDLADKADIALGLTNMIFETVGMISRFAAQAHNTRDIVLTGNLSVDPSAEGIFENLSRMFDLNFVIPQNSGFGTVIGAALCGGDI